VKPPPFDYVRAESIDHAVEELARADGEGVLLAGGQTLMPLLALRMANPAVVIDINRIDGLAGVNKVAGALRVGATTRQNDLLADPLVARHLPVLQRAVGYVGHHQTRNRGTIGGSVSLGEPAAEMPACALALDAVVEVRSSEGARRIDALDFYYGPYVNALLPDEMVTAIEYPDWPEDSITLVHEVARRPGDFALVGLVCQLALSGGKVSRAGIAWFGMGPTPMRAHQAEKALLGTLASEVDPHGLAELALADTDPFEDAHATRAYRQTVGRRVFARLLGEALKQRIAA
jgi:carbon-monoxide dehydrogenase medium subunit